ncbi:hypothetical protein SBADM41S_09604 [Streptomyces badius]
MPFMNVSIPSTAIPGRAIRITIDQKMRAVDGVHPGRLDQLVRQRLHQVLAHEEDPEGRDQARQDHRLELVHPLEFGDQLNSGITPSCGGIIIVPIVSVSSALRPLNFSLAKANPASVQHRTVPIVIDPDTISNSSALPMSASSRTCLRSS